MVRPIPIFHSYPNWQLSGVNTWTLNLITSMRGYGAFEHRVLFTGEAERKYPVLDERGIEYSFLDVPQRGRFRQEWSALKEFLESRAPCIYLTNYDWRHSCAVDLFSKDVRVCFGMQSDEKVYYDEIRRLGPAFNTLFAIDSFGANQMKSLFPDLADRVVQVTSGIELPDQVARQVPSGRLELIFAARLDQRQKRVFDLVPIAEQLKSSGLDFRLTIIGDGYDADSLRNRLQVAGVTDRVRMLGSVPNTELGSCFKESHIFLLVSDFEGVCLGMREAMAHGCVPVLYAIRGGINDNVKDGDTGFLVPHGNTKALADKIIWLDARRDEILRVGERAAAFVRGNFSVTRMADDFAQLFELTMSGRFRDRVRRSGRVRPPRDLTLRGKAKVLAKSLSDSWRRKVRHPLGVLARRAGWKRTPQAS